MIPLGFTALLVVLKRTFGWPRTRASSSSSPRTHRARQMDFVRAFLNDDDEALSRAALALGPDLRRPETWKALNKTFSALGLSLLGHALNQAMTAHEEHRLLLQRRAFETQHGGVPKEPVTEEAIENARCAAARRCERVGHLLGWGCPPEPQWALDAIDTGNGAAWVRPLLLALKVGAVDLADLLIRAGAAVHRKLPLEPGGNVPVSFIRHALSGAAPPNAQGRSEVIHLLLNRGCPATEEDLEEACALKPDTFTMGMRLQGRDVEDEGRTACIMALLNAGAPLSPTAWERLSTACHSNTEPPGLVMALEKKGVAWPKHLERWLGGHPVYAPEVAHHRAHRTSGILENILVDPGPKSLSRSRL